MSLVAYGASDDSEESDSESPKVVGQNRDDPFSDDEDVGIQTTNNSNSVSTSSNSLFDSKSFFGIGTAKQDLPPPQKTENVIIEENELEEEVRQKPSELADAPKPPPKRTKQPVKITIPSLNDIPDEEEGEDKQKPVASSVRSGLFALLPAPIHSAKKEINRPLIPHNLGKRTPSTKPANGNAQVKSSGNKNPATLNMHSASTTKSTTVHNALTGYGSDSSDDDETSESQNFFSLGSKTVTTGNSSEIVKETVAAAVKLKSDGHNTELKTDEPLSQEEEIVTSPEPGLTNDSPLTFSNPGRSWSGISANYSGGLKSNHQAHSSSYSMSYPQSIDQVSSVQYNMAGTDNAELVNELDDTEDDLQKMLGDKEFQRLNGKRKRGMDEAINFVDAKVDDYVDPSELSKYVTEETDYTSKKNKDDMPTSQQRRKKQITYLAFQAKEKELELKNTWANNKLTRRQTQAKYGF